MSELTKRLLDLKERVSLGSFDLREVGKLVFGIWDQDLAAEMVERALAADEIERLTRELAAIKGIGVANRNKGECKHEGWTFKKHGRCCPKCGTFMVDWGD
jgi:hypothetical protein